MCLFGGRDRHDDNTNDLNGTFVSEQAEHGRNDAIRSLRHFPGATYSNEEREFFAAIDHYKAATGRQFLSWHEVLRLVKRMGYRKVAADRGEPEGAD